LHMYKKVEVGAGSRWQEERPYVNVRREALSSGNARVARALAMIREPYEEEETKQ